MGKKKEVRAVGTNRKKKKKKTTKQNPPNPTKKTNTPKPPHTPTQKKKKRMLGTKSSGLNISRRWGEGLQFQVGRATVGLRERGNGFWGLGPICWPNGRRVKKKRIYFGVGRG